MDATALRSIRIGYRQIMITFADYLFQGQRSKHRDTRHTYI